MLRALRRTAMDSETREYEAALRNRAQGLRLLWAISKYRSQQIVQRSRTLRVSAVAARRGTLRTPVAERVVGSAERDAE